jgi:hypothetical protein
MMSSMTRVLSTAAGSPPSVARTSKGEIFVFAELVFIYFAFLTLN